MNVKQPHRECSTKWIGMICLILIWMIFPHTLLAKTSEKEVIGIVTGSQSSYRTAVEQIKPILDPKQYTTIVVELPKGEEKADPDKIFEDLRSAKPRLIVSVGAQSTTLVCSYFKAVPIIFCMVPNVLDQPFVKNADNNSKHTIGLTTDIAPSAQMESILHFYPSVKRLGVLYSHRTERTFAAIQSAAKDHAIQIQGVLAKKEDFMGSLNELGDQGGEGVLMLPDASVYDSTNVRALLVWAIRQKKPVFTFSDNLVKAGAFAGQYTQPEELGRQTGELIRQILQGKKFENISLQYPNAVLVAVNERTAELIGIPLDDETMKGVTKRYGKDE